MHDNFIRTILADKEVATSYFINCLPPALSQQLDFNSLAPSQDSYLSEELRKTMSDIVYTCCRKTGNGEVKVSLLIEHKTYPDKFTPVQIGSYIFSALQKQVASREPLSLVIPVLFYHGKQKWEYKTLASLFGQLEDVWKQFLPDFDYVLQQPTQRPTTSRRSWTNNFLGGNTGVKA